MSPAPSSSEEHTRRDAIDVARRTSPEERARQTLELMQTGYRLKRAALGQIAAELGRLGTPFCVVGGFSLRGEVRFTRDVAEDSSGHVSARALS